MKLEPKCRRVKIRIESGGKSCTTLDDLKRNFVIDDIFPLVEDGRLERWLRDLKKEDEATAITNISHDKTDENKRKKLVEIFFPQLFNANDAVASLVLQQLESAEISKSVAYQILHIFKNDIDYKWIITHWDSISKNFTKALISVIISPFKGKQKDVAYLWAKYIKENESESSYLDAIEVAANLGHSEAIKERDELKAKNPYLWREKVKETENLPTTPAELKRLFDKADEANENIFSEFSHNPPKNVKFEFCKSHKLLNQFYNDVYDVYLEIKNKYRYSINYFSVDYKHREELREFIQNKMYNYNDTAMKVERSNIIHACIQPFPYYYIIGIGDNFDFFSESFSEPTDVLWGLIVYVTVNIFNKERYPDWK